MVYVTGRSVRGRPAPGYDRFLAHSGQTTLPGTIEDTADDVTRLGGVGIPVPCDHTREDGFTDVDGRQVPPFEIGG